MSVKTTLPNCLDDGVLLNIVKFLVVYVWLVREWPDFLGDEVENTVDYMLVIVGSKRLSQEARLTDAFVVMDIGTLKKEPSFIDMLFQILLVLLQGVELTIADGVAKGAYKMRE